MSRVVRKRGFEPPRRYGHELLRREDWADPCEQNRAGRDWIRSGVDRSEFVEQQISRRVAHGGVRSDVQAAQFVGLRPLGLDERRNQWMGPHSPANSRPLMSGHFLATGDCA
jgi:hypothetical protein